MLRRNGRKSSICGETSGESLPGSVSWQAERKPRGGNKREGVWTAVAAVDERRRSELVQFGRREAVEKRGRRGREGQTAKNSNGLRRRRRRPFFPPTQKKGEESVEGFGTTEKEGKARR